MKRILIAKITKVHGLKGLLNVQSFSDRDLFDYPKFFDAQGKAIPLQYESTLNNNAYLVSLPHVETKEQAKSYIGIELYADRLPLEKGEFYLDDLKGLPVFDEEGKELGTIHDVKDYGASPFIVIQTKEGKLINAFFHKEAIVSLDDKKVVIKKEFIV